MDKIAETAAFGSTPYWAHDIELKPGISGGLDLALLGIQTARDLALGFADTAARIDADETLSAKGKATKKREAVEGRLRKLAMPREHLAKVRKDAVAALAKLDDADEEVSPVLMASIWQMLPTDGLELAEVYATARTRGDTATMKSVEALPSVHAAALTPDKVSELRRSRLEDIDPAAAAKLGDLERASADLENTIGTAEAMIREAAGEPLAVTSDDPLAVSLGGDAVSAAAE